MLISCELIFFLRCYCCVYTRSYVIVICDFNRKHVPLMFRKFSVSERKKKWAHGGEWKTLLRGTAKKTIELTNKEKRRGGKINCAFCSWRGTTTTTRVAGGVVKKGRAENEIKIKIIFVLLFSQTQQLVRRSERGSC